jgi:hypothetical protein
MRADDWFQVTNGGGQMNGLDALLGIIMKNWRLLKRREMII